ncbi:RNA polymerase sigma factor [Streptomyces sp. N2-109]|uniref:RNA polymerase sigma factor n=1 Tax=Streptomyces gossypii TaxID=2883101 RepID=A0ABT2JQ65_9ACTN|nr:RNA polymerase sigma factor [Streptomyces gossypii]MCT2589419.1 RNA polymerase sigma factor [Streptomyces gossypii]
MKTNQAELRRRLQAGDPDAFGTLFDTYARSVYNHAFRLTGDWSSAEDIVSLTFLEAWRLRERVEPEGGSVRPWLLGVATNVVRNTRRAARRHADAVARMPRAEAERDFTDDVAARLDGEEELALVRTALRTLGRKEREVLALCAWSGLDYASAAQALGIPVGTVRSRLSRARKQLTAALERVGRSGQMKGGRGISARSIQEGSR